MISEQLNLNLEFAAPVTIFEGPDGSGKSTAAQRYAEARGARLVHSGPFPHVRDGLARLYVEAMLPALLGYQHVVMDRSWLSERPYSHAFRAGLDRIGPVFARMLERVALRSQAVVVTCLPPWRVVRKNWRDRRGEEYLKTEEQLAHVFNLYSSQNHGLTEVLYDYTKPIDLVSLIDRARSVMRPHATAALTAGSGFGRFVLVGQDFAAVKNQDLAYQLPFVSFSREGCSWWLTNHLEHSHVSEHELFWVNADQDLNFLRSRANDVKNQVVIALGNEASEVLDDVGVEFHRVPHPMAWKRFNHHGRYPLGTIIRSLR